MSKAGLWLGAALVFVACGPRAPAGNAAGPASAEPAATADGPSPATTETSGAGPAAAPTSESSGAAPASSTGPTLRALCERTCRRMATQCSANAADSCKSNCEQYDRSPKACDPYARDALNCQENAKDMQCANIAPESCSKLFRRMADCQQAPDTFKATSEDSAKATPAGWERHDEPAAGFSALMPKGVTKTQTGGESAWVATVGKVRYVIRKLPPANEKFTPRTQVRLAGEWLKPCSLKLKLHGQLEKGPRTSVHYDVGCKDGSERHGMFHITPSALFIVGTEAPAGESSELDAFIYGFELK